MLLKTAFGWMVALIACYGALADTVTLNSGKVIEGQLVARDPNYVTIKVGNQDQRFQVSEVAALTEDSRAIEVDTIDITDITPGTFITAYKKAVSDKQKNRNCKTKCRDGGTGLDWNVACIDYCNCIHVSKQTKEKCSGEFKETTGKAPPLFLPPPTPVCGECFITTERTKKCVDEDALGQNEDLVVWVPCDQSTPDAWSCGLCGFSLAQKQSCCEDGKCWTQPCDLPAQVFTER